MKSATRVIVAATMLGAMGFALAQEPAFVEILRKAARDNGLRPAAEIDNSTDRPLASVGKRLFESERMSLNGNISCKTCHIAKFGSADGIPLAAAIYGKGEGPERLRSGAKLLPRNAFGLWGRGGAGYTTFFWDGRVQAVDGKVVSTFGAAAPSNDPLVTAVHLPPVQVREMLDDEERLRPLITESPEQARKLYVLIVENLSKTEPDAMRELAAGVGKPVSELQFIDVARALAAHIRSEFRLKDTRLHAFVFGQGTLTPEEVRGGILFYGKGKCVTCHSGPHFSDFGFHAVGFPQLGFGANGFGVDYGRYNATFDPRDLYRFKTAPLFNVEKTAPYGHSGSAATLEQAIYAHIDPLRYAEPQKMPPFARHELYKRLAAGGQTTMRIGYLDEAEVRQLVKFLGTLSF